MSEIIQTKALAVIQKLAAEKTTEAIQKNRWKRLFSESGENFILYMDKEGDFTEELKEVFSAKNMKAIAEKMEKEPGFSFPQALHDELYNLLKKYGTEEESIETYIHFFSEQIIQEIQRNDPDKNLAIFLGQWRNETKQQYDHIEQSIADIQKELRQDGSIIESIQNIDDAIKKKARYNIDLSFFELDDDAFKLKLDNAISQKQEMVFVEGKSKEETLYRILNEIKQSFPDITTWVIQNKAGWEKISRKGMKDCILIPFFSFTDLPAIIDNTNIFIYNEEVPCSSNQKIILRKRTKKNIIKALEKCGMEHTEASRIIDNTHGLYEPLKHILFKVPTPEHNPLWVQECSDVILAALLLGRWTESEGDQEAFRYMTGKEYKECFSILRQYEHAEHPLFVKVDRFGGSYYQIASIMDAWELLINRIPDQLLTRFLGLSIAILSSQTPEDRQLWNCVQEMPESLTCCTSAAIKKGILCTFILCSCFDSFKEKLSYVDAATKAILDSIKDTEDWHRISGYFPDLCEASPLQMLSRLEKELSNSTGMIELFNNRSGYVDILWAIELLLQQSKYRKIAIRLLWKIDSYNIDYKNANSPRETLERVFCAWYNITALSTEDKIKEARKAISTYENGWNIIAACLPKRNSTILSTLYIPRFKDVDEPEAAYVSDAYPVFLAYLEMCADTAGRDIERWKILIKSLTEFEMPEQSKTLVKVAEAAKEMDDPGKTAIKQRLRETVHNHRYFSDSDWSMPEENVRLFEDTYNHIFVNDPIYDYLYIFTPIYDYPTLQPTPYNRDDSASSGCDMKEREAAEDICRQIQKFKEKGYSVIRLIEYGMRGENASNVGYVIGHYFDQDTLNFETVDSILQYTEKDTRSVYGYARIVSKGSLPIIREILSRIRQKSNRIDIIAEVISLQLVETVNDCIIFQEADDVKYAFWKEYMRFQQALNAEPGVIRKALQQCFQYGSLGTYTELIFSEKDLLSVEEIYQYALKIEDLQDISTTPMTDWYIEQILEILQKQYNDDQEKSFRIARLEWICGDLIHWDQMKCMQKWIKSDPQLYAYLVERVCIKDHQSEQDEHRNTNSEKTAKMIARFRDIHFCPAERQGAVQYDELKKWVDNFKAILKRQDQLSLWDSLVGELLLESPVDEDEYMPCKAVCQLIEEYQTERMKNAYETAEINRRGVYFPDAGRGEMALARKYKNNAEKLLQADYPHTAQIYFDISDYYFRMASQERKQAEDGW